MAPLLTLSPRYDSPERLEPLYQRPQSEHSLYSLPRLKREIAHRLATLTIWGGLNRA